MLSHDVVAVSSRCVVPLRQAMEKRKFIRAEFITRGKLSVREEEYDLGVRNISLKGALLVIPGDHTVSSGTEAVLSVPLSGSMIVIQAEGVVVHVDGDEVGVKFTRIDAESMIHLRRLLELNTADPSKIEEELSFLAD